MYKKEQLQTLDRFFRIQGNSDEYVTQRVQNAAQPIGKGSF